MLAAQHNRVVYPSLALTPVIWIWRICLQTSPFFGMWQCLKVDLRFTWFTWFTILFCVLHFYILVRISSNVGFWIRFDLCMAFLPHITSASATARGGTSILGLCIARPSSSTAHAAPGLRCGRFQLTLTLRENLLVAIVFVTEVNISRF